MQIVLGIYNVRFSVRIFSYSLIHSIIIKILYALRAFYDSRVNIAADRPFHTIGQFQNGTE